MPENGKKLFTAANLAALGKLMVAVITAVVTILVFYFTMEARQDKTITETTSALSNHVEQADRTFEKLDRTMMEQRAVNERTSNAITRVTTIQQTLKEENGRLAESVEKLADEVRNANGHNP